MGVYIRGMEMPEDGETVTLTICADGLVFEEFKQPGDVFHAVPVPEHGRLGDLDALAEYVHQQDDWLSETAIHAFCGILCKTSTIIPASRGTEAGDEQ